MNSAFLDSRLATASALAAVMMSGQSLAHVDLTNATVAATTLASSELVTTAGANSVIQPGGTGAIPTWQGYSNADQQIGASHLLSTCDFFLFMNSTEVIANGFANAWVTPGADFVSADASAASKISIGFHVHGPHHYVIHSVDVNQLNGEGSAVMLRDGLEVFRFEGTHVHEIRGELPEGDYEIKLTAATQSGTSGLNSVGIFELEFEVVEGLLCVADLNGDRLVDDADFVEFAEAYNELICGALLAGREARHGEGCPADFNSDELVDDADFVVFASAYNELLCP